MINRRLLGHLTLALAIVSGANVAALAKNSETVAVMIRASLNGVQLEPGKYEVSWEARSPEVTVTISRGRNVLVTAKARIEARDVTYRHNMIVYKTNSDGSHTIKEIRFRGKKHVLVFD